MHVEMKKGKVVCQIRMIFVQWASVMFVVCLGPFREYESSINGHVATTCSRHTRRDLQELRPGIRLKYLYKYATI